MKKNIILPFFGFDLKFNFKVEKGIKFECSNINLVTANEIIKCVVSYEGLKTDIGEDIEYIKKSIVTNIIDTDLKRPTTNSFDVHRREDLYYLVDYSDYCDEYKKWEQAMNEKYSCDISITSRDNNFDILITVVRN